MSKKRGLSVEEKRQKMMEIFYEKKECFQLKELEKLAPKEKGITPMSVKDVVQSLLDDNMIESEKIGTSIYFWSFPSQAANLKKRKIEKLNAQLVDSETKKQTLLQDLSDSKKGKEKSDERDTLVARLGELRAERDKLASEVAKYKDCDPDVLRELQERTRVALDASNRWTDNVFAIKSWCKNKFGMEEANINKMFEIPEDLDYLEQS